MAFRKAKRLTLRALARNVPLMAVLVMTISIGSLLSLGYAGNNGNGNGAPAGAHFDLNIIGVKNTANFPCAENSGGNVIFVPLNTAGLVDVAGKSAVDIFLSAGPSFAVLADEAFGNALGKGACQAAMFQLPLVVANCGVSSSTTFTSGCTTSSTIVSGTTTFVVGGQLAYEVWARVKGIPNGSGTITTCGQSISTSSTSTTTTTVCSLNQLVIGKNNPNKLFIDVTSLLTSICFNPVSSSTTLTTTVSCVPIFSPLFQNFFWSYDNQGNKVLQLRFYPCSDPQLSCPGFGI